MAKASKKPDTKSSEIKAEAKPKAAAKAPAAKAKAPAAKKPASPGGAAPLIDTNLAASAAAAMILNRAGTGGAAANASGQPAAKKESSSFKNLKDSLNKPASQSLGGTFGNIAGQKKSNQPLGGGKQVGRNQTFGADVNRAGVPRRTGGG
jgi:hypothetical protein